MEEPGGLQSMGSQRVRLNWVTSVYGDSYISGTLTSKFKLTHNYMSPADLFIVYIIRNPPLHHLLDTLTCIPPHQTGGTAAFYLPKKSLSILCNLQTMRNLTWDVTFKLMIALLYVCPLIGSQVMISRESRKQNLSCQKESTWKCTDFCASFVSWDSLIVNIFLKELLVFM